MWQQRPPFNNWLDFKTISDYIWFYFADKYFATKCTGCHSSLELNGKRPYISFQGEASLLWEWNFREACQTYHALHASLGNQIWFKKIERHLQEKKENGSTIMMQEFRNDIQAFAAHPT